MLLTVGALGYEKATVQEVAERAGISRDQFHRRFGGKDECFGQAYEEAAERLCEDLLEAGRKASSWRLGFRAALAELLRFVAEQPLLAKALLLEVRAARGQAWAKHQQVVEKLIAAVDTARSEEGALSSVSRMTAGFMVGAIEESIGLEIGAGRAAAVERLLPDLSHLVALNYFGEDEAWLELRSDDAPAQAR
ncbi:MAG TPA: TetR/AcrR family transcriptional regulator [Solirubrobacterales bacterium]|jgi:AcrR family transcriptional regulator|nr:TetR/AcrR family transcriptional regulator [Solirubrobacterales bacterium]